MGFKKPIRSLPVVPGSVYASKLKRKRMRQKFGQIAMATGVGVFVFVAGMLVTNWSTVSSALPSFPGTTAAVSECEMLSVHDGDTIRCGVERIRIENIDAPELPDSPKCKDSRRSYAWCDFQAGFAASDALRGFLAQGRVHVQRQGLDRYGRTLARVSVNGRDAGEYLVSVGLAKPWR